MELDLNILQVDSGQWAVYWTRDNFVRDNQTRGGLLYIVFDEMKLDRVKFGCLLNNNESEWLEVDSIVYWQDPTDSFNVLSQYVLAGVLFDTEHQARTFVEILNKLYFIAILQKGL